jgi:hypothetical protein
MAEREGDLKRGKRRDRRFVLMCCWMQWCATSRDVNDDDFSDDSLSYCCISSCYRNGWYCVNEYSYHLRRLIATERQEWCVMAATHFVLSSPSLMLNDLHSPLIFLTSISIITSYPLMSDTMKARILKDSRAWHTWRGTFIKSTCFGCVRNDTQHVTYTRKQH